MAFDSENGLPFLATALLTSVGLLMLIVSLLKGNKRIKRWIIPVIIHNISLYVQFVDNSFFEDKYTVIHLIISGIGLISLIIIAIIEYNEEFPLNHAIERKRILQYIFYSLTSILVYILLLHLIFNTSEKLYTFFYYILAIGILFSIFLLLRIYKKKKRTPTHMSIVIILVIIEVDLILYIITDFTTTDLYPFLRVFDAGIGIGMLFFAFIASVENQLLEIYEKERLQNKLLRRTQDKIISQTQLSSIQIISGGFAHDFNNILTSIIGNISLIEDYPIFQGEGKEFIIDLKSASSQAKNMVNQLLVFSKGEEFLNKEIITFKEILKITTDFTLRGRKSKPIYDIDKNLWAIYGDPIRISQIIQNLVINADQSMPEGGIIELNAQNVEIEDNNQFNLQPGKYLLFQIKDSGVGIPSNIQEKIFTPFFTTKPEGQGFGLSICKKIVEDHQGYINFKTTVDKGSIFYFYTPAKMNSTIINVKHEQLKDKFSGFALILDDNFLVLRVIESMLKNLGIKSITSSESTTFLSTYQDMLKKKINVDILIVDLTLPGDIGGKQLIKDIRRFNPEAYVVVSSGYSNDFVLQNYQDYGFNDLLRKPYDKNELIKVLEKAFKNKNPNPNI